MAVASDEHHAPPGTRRAELLSARVLREAIDKTFRGALREAQGVFAIHEHGGADRPAHPHVHGLLSPRFQNRMAVHISPARIQRVKERWEREVLAGLQRQERRLPRMRHLVSPVPARPRDRDDRLPVQVLPFRPAARRNGQLELFIRASKAVPRSIRKVLRLLRGVRTVGLRQR